VRRGEIFVRLHHRAMVGMGWGWGCIPVVAKRSKGLALWRKCLIDSVENLLVVIAGRKRKGLVAYQTFKNR
jgi:hypothetical protein